MFNIITMPPLTQIMGVYIKYPANQKYYKKLSFEKEVMTQLIDALPKFDYFSQNFDKKISNWLPFCWKGFEQTTRYTYLLEDLTFQDLEKKLENDVRRRCRKGTEAGLFVLESEDIEKFYEINSLTFLRKGNKIPYSFDFVKKLYEVCKIHNSVKIYFAVKDDTVMAVNFLIYDQNTVYYLMGGIHPAYKDLGGMDLVLVQSIRFALESGLVFDFEGSMVESIEKYFRSFGAIQKPYFSIKKTNSLILKTRNLFV